MNRAPRHPPGTTTALLLLVGAVAACSQRGLGATDPVDSAIGQDLSDPDLAAARLRVTWSLVYNDRPADCATAGVTRVGLMDSRANAAPLEVWPCTMGSATSGPLPVNSQVALVPLDGTSTPLAYAHLLDRRYYEAGVHDLAVTFHISDDPVPQLRQLFDSLSAWYLAHGRTFPPDADWTPFGPGICCNYQPPDVICPGDPKVFAGHPWSDLGFAIDHGFRFSYRIQSSLGPPATFTITASGDRNCDGRIFAEDSLTGTWNGTTFDGKDKLTVKNPGQ